MGPGTEVRTPAWSKVVAALVMACAVGAIAWLGYGPGRGETLPVPPVSASPAEVVRSYVESVDARDCATARRLWRTPVPDPVCDVVDTMEDLEVKGTSREDPRWSGHRPIQQVANVSVRLDLGEGPMPWAFLLVRDAPGDPWLIFDHGTG